MLQHITEEFQTNHKKPGIKTPVNHKNISS